MLKSKSIFDGSQKDLSMILVAIVIYAILLSPWGFIPYVFGYEGCCQAIGDLQHAFYLSPYISQFFSATVTSLFGIFGGVFFGRLLFPVLVLLLLTIIFRRHLSMIWSITLSLLAVSVIVGYPFHHFLLQIFTGNVESLGSEHLPELLYFPIPSFSTFYFLTIFYFATSRANAALNFNRLSAFTILFSLMVYINAIDVIFSIPFWFIFFPIRLFRGKLPFVKILTQCSIQLFLFILIIAPAFFLSMAHLPAGQHSVVGVYYVGIYLLLPLALIGLLFLVQRIDPYDLLYRFRHVYIMMLAEIVMLLVSVSGIFPLNLQISQNRLAQFFAHTYYYLPVIYYASQFPRQVAFGIESSEFAKQFRTALHLFFCKYCLLYLLPVLLLLCLYNLSSGMKYIELLAKA